MVESWQGDRSLSCLSFPSLEEFDDKAGLCCRTKDKTHLFLKLGWLSKYSMRREDRHCLMDMVMAEMDEAVEEMMGV